jgi:hypothetical protein
VSIVVKVGITAQSLWVYVPSRLSVTEDNDQAIVEVSATTTLPKASTHRATDDAVIGDAEVISSNCSQEVLTAELDITIFSLKFFMLIIIDKFNDLFF